MAYKIKKILTVNNIEALSKEIVDHIIKIGQYSIIKYGKFMFVISRGKTPRYIFKRLINDDNLNKLDWSKIYIFFQMKNV